MSLSTLSLGGRPACEAPADWECSQLGEVIVCRQSLFVDRTTATSAAIGTVYSAIRQKRPLCPPSMHGDCIDWAFPFKAQVKPAEECYLNHFFRLRSLCVCWE